MRERQTQTLSPTSGLVIAASTTYDGRGMVYDEDAPEAVPGTAGSGYLVPADGAQWQNRTRHLYDALGRASAEQQITRPDAPRRSRPPATRTPRTR